MNILLKTKELHSCIIRKISCEDKIITPVQGQIINYLINSKNDVYQKDIEKFLRLRRSTISGILHTMEKNDLILKDSIEEDARIKRITLTDKALQIYDDVNLKFNKLNDEICKNINEEELIVFSNIIDKMINNIRK